jgi:carbamoyl-phosphate synthase large subunit
MIEEVFARLRKPNSERIFYIADALRLDISIDDISKATQIDPWFLHNIKEIIDLEKQLLKCKDNVPKDLFIRAKEYGFSDQQLAKLWDKKEEQVYQLRRSFGIKPSYKLVDTCAAEFQAYTPYFYSTYEQ